MNIRVNDCVSDMKELLDHFEQFVPDLESNRLVRKFCAEKHRWPKAHGLHSTLRDRNTRAIKQNDCVRQCQHCFEEVDAKTLYNLTRLSAPFDPDSPYWVLKNALALSNALGLPSDQIVQIVAPNKSLETDA